MATTTDSIRDVIVSKGFTREEADKAMRTLIDLECIKIDRHNGSWALAHEAFLEPDVLRRAITHNDS